MTTSQTELEGRRQGMSPAEITAMVTQLVQNGQAQSKLTELFEDNFKLRGDKQKLQADLDAANAKLPKDGSLVISGDDVTLFNEVKAMGKDPKAIKDLVKEHGDLTTEVTDLRRKTTIAQIAEVENWKPGALERLTVGMDLAGVEEVEEEVDDPDEEGAKKKVKVKRGFINVKDSGGKASKKRLSEELSEFLPSLSKADAEERDTDARAVGEPLPRMARGDKGADRGTKSISKDFIQRKYGKKDDKK